MQSIIVLSSRASHNHPFTYTLMTVLSETAHAFGQHVVCNRHSLDKDIGLDELDYTYHLITLIRQFPRRNVRLRGR